jgi:hypothetical protein
VLSLGGCKALKSLAESHIILYACNLVFDKSGCEKYPTINNNHPFGYGSKHPGLSRQKVRCGSTMDEAIHQLDSSESPSGVETMIRSRWQY